MGSEPRAFGHRLARVIARVWRCAGVFLAMLFLCGPLRADDAAQVDRYLERLGLSDLRLLHQQQQLAALKHDDERASAARELSELYAQRLLEVADEPERFRQLVARVEQLVAAHPTADSPQLQVMLLQAEYQRAEAQALAWIDDPGNAGLRREARETLSRLLPALAQRRAELAQQLNELQTRAEAVEVPADAARGERASDYRRLEQEMNRLQAVLARALFFEGWAGFLHGLVSESAEQAKPHFEVAQRSFGQLLEVDTGSEEGLALDPATLDLHSVWRARALMGLGASLAAAGHEKAADACFAALAHPATPPGVRDSVLYWHLLALVGSQQWEEAERVAARELERLSSDRASAIAPACVLLVRTAWASPAAPSETLPLAQLGLQGLARLKQFDVLGALVAKYRPEPTAADGFYALWAKGKLVFAEAEKSHASADYERAAQWIQQALALPTARDDPASAAQCHYSLAWCDYRREQFPAAIRRFEQAASQFKTLGEETAVQAAWMVFTCHQQLHAQTKEARHEEAALRVLAALKRDYPESEQAGRADVLLARMQSHRTSPEEAIKSLEAVSPAAPNYLAARYELCVARHQLWKNLRTDPPAAAPVAEALRRDVDAYLAATPQTEAKTRLRAALLVIDVLLAAPSPEWLTVAGYLTKVEAAAARLDPSDALTAEYHYRRLQLAQQRGEQAAVREEADWLATHAAGSPYELPGLVIVARQADAALASASDAQRSERREQSVATYRRLVKLLGESSAEIAAKKNALVANSKLAQYEFESGDFAAAAERLEAIVTAYPNDSGYLRRAGLAWQRVENYARALPHWSVLVAGSSSASDAWYEAKYYQLVCLAKVDPPEARKAWRQFVLLHPEVKSAAWKSPFAELARTSFGDR
jgi:hypothetical protein